jgi:hypothetical protein
MILVYADGGGLGHLTRVQSLRRTLDLREPVCVLTSSDHRDDRRIVADLEIIPVPFRRNDREARRSWLQRTVADLRPSSIIVDAFPAGLAGEIDEATVGSVPCDHVARLLRWPAYRPLVPTRPASFRTTYLLEAISDPEHRAHLDRWSARVVDLDLIDPPPDPGTDRCWPAAVSRPPDGRPRWLVAHTGPAAEVADLVAHARDQAAAEGETPLLVVASPASAAPAAASDLVVVDRYPVWPLFETADRIITAAGFNSMRQLAPHRDRHRFVPMPRRFDDQFERARRERRP